MKKLILIIVIFQSQIFFAGEKDLYVPAIKFPFWTVSAEGGLIAPLGNFGNLYNNSPSAGFELEYHPFHRLALFFNPQYDFLSAKDNSYNGTAGYVELGAGAKLFMGKASETFFVEAGIGDYFYYYTSNITNNNTTHIQGSFAVKAGIGGNLPITERIMFFLKTDFHMVFTPSSKTFYPGLYSGFRLKL